jgi:hypothetical protein
VLAVDVTERLRAEREIARMARAQKLLSACNETLVRATSESALLQAICQIAVDIGGYRMGWVGFATTNTRRLPARPMLATNTNTWTKCARPGTKTAPPAEACRSGGAQRPARDRARPAQEQRPGRDPAHAGQRFSWRDLPACAHRARPLACCTCTPRKSCTSSPQETALLQDLANDLAFGITSLRAHKAQQRIQDSVIKVAAAVSASTGTAFLCSWPPTWPRRWARRPAA